MSDDLERRLIRLQRTATSILALVIAFEGWFGVDRLMETWTKQGANEGLAFVGAVAWITFMGYMILRWVDRHSD